MSHPRNGKSGVGQMIAVTLGAAVVSCAVILSTAVVADKLEPATAAPAPTQRHQVDRTNKGDALNVKRDAPSAMLPGCESAFSLPSPESLMRRPSRCVTETNPPADRKLAALR